MYVHSFVSVCACVCICISVCMYLYVRYMLAHFCVVPDLSATMPTPTPTPTESKLHCIVVYQNFWNQCSPIILSLMLLSITAYT